MNKETTALQVASPVRKKMTGKEILDRVTTVAAIVAVPVITTVAHAEDATVDVGTLALSGLSASAAAVFAIKASPSLMMWGYRKILGFIGR
jgi:hypothetical protein